VTAIRRDMPLEELAAAICSALENDGVTAVLSGGAAVSLYTNNRFQSADLDFIRTGIAVRVDRTMERLGFEKQPGRYWSHPESEFFVEFPPGPVMVADDLVTEFAERRTAAGTLRLLAPTECVMDRLTIYFVDGDPQCLEQAVAVARAHPVDHERIREWAGRQGRPERFENFLGRLEPRSPEA
jgi:hypothetical protein